MCISPATYIKSSKLTKENIFGRNLDTRAAETRVQNMSNLGQTGKMHPVLSHIKLVDTGFQRANRLAYRQNVPVKANVKM